MSEQTGASRPTCPTGEPRAWRDALNYITSPTMGLPGGADAYTYAQECPEHMARMALQICIRMAREALLLWPDPYREPVEKGQPGPTADGAPVARCGDRIEFGGGAVAFSCTRPSTLAHDECHALLRADDGYDLSVKWRRHPAPKGDDVVVGT